ncbi:DNA-binding response regulator, OmpR family, contains REC and winged-helix (wHTH) domain [Paenibacillus sp. UNC496MF]|uniref:response regulator transcription factor n=1 Tax=Paenibacillus sp. UNC496MF TaxID=1502753 RepID=UPI0008EB3EA4|nr:response regulator transcription factor [Paenibacillus sp. UNC496MF]SFJ35502.1 DNA-binding response regulator, OmpR family, contains REC and winged-helix (wHTH) domain [Paenibacillus sp. UNC496MF]
MTTKTILLIEDDVSISELQKDYLEISGFNVDIAADGESGLSKSLSGKYDLVILDVMLPKKNGFEVCKGIREKRDIPILMVTSRSEDIDVIRGLGLGADDYIAKPFKPAELVARVKAHLARYDRLTGAKSAKNDVHIRGLRIEPDTRKVFVNETETALTTKEFDLLYVLASNPGRVFTKEHLFERIWDIGAKGDMQTITVHIRKIREKIEQDPANPTYIETVWGTGYRFKD